VKFINISHYIAMIIHLFTQHIDERLNKLYFMPKKLTT